MIDDIHKNAELVVYLVHKHFGERVGYNRNGVQWLDSYIQQLHRTGVSASEKLVSTLGVEVGLFSIPKLRVKISSFSFRISTLPIKVSTSAKLDFHRLTR